MCPPLSERTDRVSDRQREGSPQAQNRPCTSRLYQPTANTKFQTQANPLSTPQTIELTRVIARLEPEFTAKPQASMHYIIVSNPMLVPLDVTLTVGRPHAPLNPLRIHVHTHELTPPVVTSQ